MMRVGDGGRGGAAGSALLENGGVREMRGRSRGDVRWGARDTWDVPPPPPPPPPTPSRGCYADVVVWRGVFFFFLPPCGLVDAGACVDGRTGAGKNTTPDGRAGNAPPPPHHPAGGGGVGTGEGR